MAEGRILLVDDEESFRRLVARELGRAGRPCPSTGEAALAVHRRLEACLDRPLAMVVEPARAPEAGR